MPGAVTKLALAPLSTKARNGRPSIVTCTTSAAPIGVVPGMRDPGEASPRPAGEPEREPGCGPGAGPGAGERDHAGADDEHFRVEGAHACTSAFAGSSSCSAKITRPRSSRTYWRTVDSAI